MELYLKLFEVLFPVFFVVGIGYYLGKNNPKIDTTFITNFAANIGTPAMIIYALTSTGTSFEIFKNYFWYFLIAIAKLAIESNVAAATIIPREGDEKSTQNDGQLKIAFDGDAVIFSDDSEKVFHEEGLDAFIENEMRATTALKEGPFKSFLVALNKIQNDFDVNDCPIRTALVTARSAPSDKRVIKTLREWGVRIDESLFLGGMSKQHFLKSFQADIFFDDQKKHIIEAMKSTASGHVPYGIKNK